MGSSKKVTVSYWYKLIMHLGWCKGPIDALLEIRGGDRTAWKGRKTTSGDIYINRPELYGGESAEGGIQGTFEVMMGEPDQMPSAYMASEFGDAQPGYRGRATVLLKGPKIGAGNPYPKPLFFKLERILKGWDDNAVWFPERAVITGARSASAMNSDIYIALDVSGSLTVTQFGHLKAAMLQVLDALEQTVADQGVGFRIMLVAFAGGNTTIERFSDPSGFSDLRAWVSALTQSTGTTAAAAYTPALSFFSATNPNNNVLVCLSDGEMEDAASFAAGPISDMIDQQNEPYSLSSGTAVKMRGIGIGSQVSLGYFDNSGLPIPIITGTNTEQAANATLDMIFENSGANYMNPAHILYDSITSRRENGGLEEPVARVNDASFRAAAEKLYAERFGLCCTWYGGESAEQFQQRICNVIGGSITQSRMDGQYYLDLLRDVANPLLLPTITDDDILDWEDEPAVPSESINQIQVKWFDPETREERITTPVQALGAIEEAGGILADVREYYEIPYEALALRVAQRDLQSVATALRKFTFSCTRKAFDLRPGMQIRLLCPKRGFADVIAVVGDIDYGDFANDEISIVALQDVFSLPESAFVDPQEGLGPVEGANPANITSSVLIETPYVELVAAMTTADLDALSDETGFIMAGARRPSNGNNYQLATRAVGEEYEMYGTGDWTPSARVVEGDPLVDAPPRVSFTYTGGQFLDNVAVGTWALWGSEMCRVDAIDRTALTLTLGRAVGDTAPVPHAPDEMIYFIGDWYASDAREYVDGETVNAKLLNKTSQAQVPIAYTSELAVEMNARHARPYPPGNLMLDGDYFPATTQGDVALSWAHRDRLLQADQLIDFTASDIGPEPGTTYGLEVYDTDTETLVHSESGITGNTTLLPASSLASRNRLELFSVRDLMESFTRVKVSFISGFVLSSNGTLGGVNNGSVAFTLEAEGASSPVVWSIESGWLPVGLAHDESATDTLTVSGVLNSTPGYYYVTFKSVDDNGAVGYLTVHIAVGQQSSLLHFDGADGSTTFTDETGKAWSRFGNAEIDTAQSVFGGASAYFDRNGDWIETPNHADHRFGASDFTIHARIRLDQYPTVDNGASIFSKVNTNTTREVIFSVSGVAGSEYNRLGFEMSTNGSLQSANNLAAPTPTPLALNTWYHVAVSRKNGKLRLYLDGQKIGEAERPVQILNGSSAARIGRVFQSGQSFAMYFPGWIDEHSVIRGVALYDSDSFVLPASASDFSVSPTALRVNGFLPTGRGGAAYSDSTHIVISGGTGPYSVAVIDGALPAGWTASVSGSSVVVAGAGATAGDYACMIEVTDSLAATARLPLKFRLVEGWNLAGCAYSGKSLLPAGTEYTGAVQGLTFSRDGLMMYVGRSGTSNNYGIFQHRLSAPWDVSTATYTAGDWFDFGTLLTTGNGFFFSPEGDILYALGGGTNLTMWRLDTPWDVRTMVNTGKSFTVSNTNAQNLAMSEDLTRIIYANYGANTLRSINLDVRGDVSRAADAAVSMAFSEPTGLVVSPDGRLMWVARYQTGSGTSANRIIVEYAMSTPWSQATAVATGVTFAYWPEQGQAQAIFVGDNGKKLYIAGNMPNAVHQYDIV